MKMNKKFVLSGSILLFLALTLPFFFGMATVTYTPTATGDFYINGTLATEDTVMEVFDPDLNIKFILTSGDENEIEYVWIRVHGPDLIYGGTKMLGDYTLSHTGTNTWGRIYTLPHKGTFTIKGLIYGKATGNRDLRLMSFVGTWTGTEGTINIVDLGEEDHPLILTVTRWFLGLAGLVFIGIGLIPKKNRRR